ncbi:hypothetical protein [Sphingomonas sp.]|uniref:hypothetical protein n=1 Tax=Sphingomonas sp. TaxID=28214 RepID=UPI0031DFB7E5
MNGVASLALLAERLHWPIPRVRWEAARQFAQLIRNGDQLAREHLLAWSKLQKLESDALMLPSIIHAFALQGHFTFGEVHAAIVAPSVLSDALLDSIYPGEACRLFSFRLAYSKGAWADPPENELFDDGLGKLVPPIFRSLLARLQRASQVPFLSQWRGEWNALQDAYSEAYSSYPDYFFRGDRGQTGSLDVRQRAVYVSAYLRTLSWALLEVGLPQPVALDSAEIALPFNRGLSDFEASPRPDWSKNLLGRYEELGPRKLAQALWRDAAESLDKGFEPLGLDIVDTDELTALRVEIHRTFEDRDAPRTTELSSPGWVHPQGDDWTLEGPLSNSEQWDQETGLRPFCVAAQPRTLGRSHIDLVLSRMLVADPMLATGVASLTCEKDRVVVNDHAGLLSTLQLWYADWSPTHVEEFGLNGSLTSCRSTALRKFARDCKVHMPRLARIRVAQRKYRHDKYTIVSRTFRM